MATLTRAKSPLKVIPGRGLSGRDIKNRLRNRTLEGQSFGNEHYTVDEEMDRFMKLSKTEQIAAVKQNSQEIHKIQRDLDDLSNKQDQRRLEAEIERKVQEKLKELGKAELEKQTAK